MQTKKTVLLIKRSHTKNIIINIEDSEKGRESLKLLSDLAKGEESGDKNGWFSIEEVKKALGI